MFTLGHNWWGVVAHLYNVMLKYVLCPVVFHFSNQKLLWELMLCVRRVRLVYCAQLTRALSEMWMFGIESFVLVEFPFCNTTFSSLSKCVRFLTFLSLAFPLSLSLCMWVIKYDMCLLLFVVCNSAPPVTLSSLLKYLNFMLLCVFWRWFMATQMNMNMRHHIHSCDRYAVRLRHLLDFFFYLAYMISW